MFVAGLYQLPCGAVVVFGPGSGVWPVGVAVLLPNELAEGVAFEGGCNRAFAEADEVAGLVVVVVGGAAVDADLPGQSFAAVVFETVRLAVAVDDSGEVAFGVVLVANFLAVGQDFGFGLGEGAIAQLGGAAAGVGLAD